MRPFRTTFVLAGLLLLFVLFIFLVEKPREQRRTERQQAAKKVFHVAWDKVDRISLTSDAGTFDVVRHRETWTLHTPRVLPADRFQVQSLLDRLKEMDLDRTIDPEGKDPTSYGLDRPQVQVSFQAEGMPAPKTLQLGNKTQVGYSVYARVTDTPAIFLVSASYTYSLKKKVDELRDHRVLNFDRFSVERIDLASPAGRSVLVHKGAGWWVQDGGLFPANDEEVNRVLNVLSGLRVDSFEKDDPTPKDLKRYGLTHPTITVALTLENGVAAPPLCIGARSKDLRYRYVRVATEPFVYDVRYDVVDDLIRPSVAYRDRRLFPGFVDAEVERIVLHSPLAPTAALNLTPQGDHAWALNNGPRARDRAVAQILSDLRDACAVGFAQKKFKTLAPYGLDKPTESVALYLKSATEPYVLRIGRDAGRGLGLYAVTATADTLYLVDPKLTWTLSQTPEKLKEP